MSDSTPAPSETPKQPASPAPAPVVAKAPAAATEPTPAAAKPVADPKVIPAADAAPAKPAEPAKAAEPVKPAADPAKPAEPVVAADPEALPDLYEIKPPEGVSLEEGVMQALSPALKAAGIKPAQVQAIAEAYIKFQTDAPKRMLERDMARTLKDPAVGGVNYAKTMGLVTEALNAFSDPEFSKWLGQAGIANRLEFVRVFARIGEAMTAGLDRPERGQPDATQGKTRAQRMYGSGSQQT